MTRLMNMAMASVAIMLVPCLVVAQTEWDEAERGIVRMPPDSFPTLPSEARSVLTHMGCLIPQAWGNDGRHNVVSGSFARAGQTDWAALCSVDGSSAIVILWGGNASCPSPVESPVEDRGFLQHTGVDGILFSRGIDPVRPDSAYWSFPEGFTKDSITHDAIADAFYEKGATAYYCHHGSWREFLAGH